MKKLTPKELPPPIEPQKLYPVASLDQFAFGKAALRTARQDGLKVIYYRGRAWVLGSDLIQHIVTKGKSERSRNEVTK